MGLYVSVNMGVRVLVFAVEIYVRVSILVRLGVQV